MTRLLLGGVVVAVALVAVPGAFASTQCPLNWKAQDTGLYDPTTGHPIQACMPYPGPR